jgi:hypothetical protein
LALTIGIAFAVGPSTVARATGEIPTFTGDEFNQLFDEAELDNLVEPGDAPSITGVASVDDTIRRLAEVRGYVRRPVAGGGGLRRADGERVQPPAGSAWQELETAAADAGYDLVLTSAYRSYAVQRSIFLGRLASYSETSIEIRLRTAAPPGYSKHQTGYALDVTQLGYSIGNFVYSPGYAWLAADNFTNAKRFGFIPSYPSDATDQGPNPEPWELVWVGYDNLVCFGHEPSGADPFCDDNSSVFASDIAWAWSESITSGCNPPDNDRFCPDRPVTRGEMAAFLVRSFDIGTTGDEPANDLFTDDLGSVFERDIEAVAAAGITTGCNPPDNDRFCPDDTVTRGQMAAFLARALGLGDVPTSKFVDDDSSVFERDIERIADAGITVGCNPPAGDRFCPDDEVTRGQMVAFLRRAAAP